MKVQYELLIALSLKLNLSGVFRKYKNQYHSCIPELSMINTRQELVK